VVLVDGKHHNAADAALGFLGNFCRIHSLQLHSHAKSKKLSSEAQQETKPV
jgi:hypothetical protein